MRQAHQVAIAILAIAANTGALADKGGIPGHARHIQSGSDVNAMFRIGERERGIVMDYYAAPAHASHCPPGLAKKGKGCMPPGQARKWRVGHPLGRDIVQYDLPVDLARRLSAPPEGHRYVRVAADILLIALGTAMVVDAIEDIVR